MLAGSWKRQTWRYLHRAKPQHPAQVLDLLPSPPCLPCRALTGGDVGAVHPKPLPAPLQLLTHSSALGPWHSSASLLGRDTPKPGSSSIFPAECVHFWQQGESKQG